MKQTYLKSLFLSLLMIVVGNVAIAAPGDEIKSPDNVVSGKSYYIKGVYTSSGTETACYYAPTDAAGKFTGNAVTDISAALPIKFTQVDDGWTLTTPNGYYVRPHTSNGQTFLVADEVVLQLASGTTKEGTGKGIKIGPYTNTNDGSDWYIQCNNSNPKIGGYKTTSNQWDVTLIECGDAVSSAATFADTRPSIEFPATNTYSQEVTTAEGYSGTVTYEITANTAGATIDGSTVTVTQAGSVTVKATAPAIEGFLSSTATYTLTVTDAREENGLAYAESSQQVTVGQVLNAPKLTNPYDLPVTYSSSDTSIATVDADGNVTGVAVGTATITATFEGNNQYMAGSASYTINVKKALPEGTLFYESVSKYTGSSDANTELTTTYTNLDSDKWGSFSKVYPGKGGHLKFGSSSAAGTAVTGSIALTGNGKLTYKVMRYDSSNAGKLTISVDGADVAGDTEVTGTEAWVEKTVYLTNATGNVVITFASDASNKRIRVDDILLVEAETVEVSSAVTFAETAPSIDFPATSTYTQEATTAEGYTGTVTYEITANTAGATIEGSTLTVTQVGSVTVKATAAATEGFFASTATYTLTVKKATVLPEGTLFYESVSGYTETSDNNTELSPAYSGLDSDNWDSFSKVYPGKVMTGDEDGHLKFGSSSSTGKAVTGSIALNGNGKLTYKVRSYDSKNAGKLTVSVTGADFDGDTEVTGTEEWVEKTVNLTNANGEVVITFETSSDNKRIRVDDIMLVKAEAPTTYTLVRNDDTEYPFEGLTLTTDALPAEAYFHIKDNFGNNYYAISTDEEIPYAVAITAENHDDLSTRVSTSDDIEDICRFFLGKQNTWVFTITPAEDGTIKLAVNPETPTGETKYMINVDTPFQDTEDVFSEDGKLTKVMTTGSFYIVRSDDYAIVPLLPSQTNDQDEYANQIWKFSDTDNQVGFGIGYPYAWKNNQTPYQVSEADTYNFTLDLENKTVTVEAVQTTYTLVADGGYGWSEWEFEGLLLNEEFPNGTEFYIKDNKGNVYYGEYGNSIIYAENHENLNTYYPVEDETVTEKPKPFELRKNAVWHFTITEPTEDGETIKLTVVPSTIEEETKYMLSSEWMQTSEDVFDENLQITKEFTAGEAFFITREDGFGIFNVTAAEKNDPDGYYVWEFSEDAPTVGYLPAKTQNAFRMKDAGTYTITLDTENQTVTIETVPTTYTLVTVDETLTEYPFSGLTLTKELPAHTKFYIKDNKDNEYHSADAQSELIIIAENHENLPTSADGKDFYLKKANTWVFTLTEASDGLMLTVSPETEGETKYMLSGYLQESDDVFDENLKLTKEMTSTTEEFYFTRSDDYGLTNLTPATFNAPEDRRYWIFSEDNPTVEFIAGEIRGSYTVGEAGTYTFTIDLTNNTVTAEKTVEYVDLTISSAEWATYVTPVAVLFPDDVTAYIITEITGGNAKAEQITEAPAGTPVIVNGTAGIHKLLKVENAILDYTNMLQVSDGTVTGDGSIYVLAVEGGQAGFAPLSNGKKLSEGKAYLKVENASGAKINFVTDGDATDIRNIENAVDFSDGDWYNLQGVKVTNPQRGIYIHNGKKVVVK